LGSLFFFIFLTVVFFLALGGIIINTILMIVAKLTIFKVFLIINVIVVLLPIAYILFLSIANRKNVFSAIISYALNSIVPNEVLIEGVPYRNGFYGDLWPVNIIYTGESYKIGKNEFYRVKGEQFDLVHSNIGSSAGILFCKKEQWENARTYYANSENFLYYCLVGNKHNYNNYVVTTLTDIDPSKFDDLLTFANKNYYNPFSSNKGIKTRRLPIPDRNVSKELTFYKESRDGIFQSDRSHIFLIVDGKLLLVFQYDYGHGKYKELVAVDVPDELGQYFIEIINKIL